MILKLQIALTILACLFVVAVFPVAAWTSLGWGVVLALCALLCYGGVLLCKQKTKTDDEAEEQDEEEIPSESEESLDEAEEDLENQEK